MKNFDFNYIQRKIIKSFWRFPIVVIFIITATISALVDYFYAGNNYVWTHLYLTSVLAIPLFTSINLYLERVETSRWFNIGINIIGFIILVLFFVNLPYKFIYDKHYIRSFILFLAFITSMFYLPFIGFHQQMPFWFYNYNFIKRIGISFFYATVFFLGIFIALNIIWYLFEINTYKLITPFSIIFYILFFPWMVLAGLSPKFNYHADKIYYPTYLKSITQYALMPLITLYAIILLAYIAKIVISGIWPSGWTVGIIIGYSLGLLLVIILIYPILFNAENKILKKLIYIHLFASILFFIVYFIAIFKRIESNGLTENRIFVILYGIWFLFLTIYFIIKKINDLRVITFSLLLILFLSVSGPWNVFRIAKKNQLNRLIKIAQSEKIFINGKIQVKNTIIKQTSEAEISNIVHYLVTTHGHKSIKHLFVINVDSLFNTDSNIYSNLEIIFNSAGLRFNLYNYNEHGYSYKLFKTDKNEFIYPIENARYLFFLELYSYDSSEKIIIYPPIDSINFSINFNANKGFIKILVNNIEDATLWLSPFYNYITDLQKNKANFQSVNQNDFKAIAKGKFYDYTFYFKEVEFLLNKDEHPKPTMVRGIVLIGPIFKKQEGSNKSI